MRIIHDVLGFMQQTVGTDGPYAKKVDPPDEKSTGFPVSLMAVPDPNHKQPWMDEEEAIYIEGDAAHILAMLKTWMHMIEGSGDQFVKDGLIPTNWRDKGKRPKEKN